ncbi:sensor histidine kinase [Rheinheimera texasensis]|uniref:sensor histidine kinase n=1 Tax=Rheinheimera texasensis TaxID=306205 RepID=UPI0004E23C35|nr:ATP-binding protein [Rheinheimera texasensis]
MDLPRLHFQLNNRLPLGICVLNAEYQVLYWNDFFSDRTGQSLAAIQGQNLLEMFPAQSRYLKKKIDSVLVLNNASFSYWEHQPHVFPFSSSRPITGEETLMYQNIEFLPIESEDSSVHNVCLVVQDVTELASYFQAEQLLSAKLEQEGAELKALNEKLSMAQSQLLQSEKMAAIGQLAAGVAHEINNPIGFISSNLQTLQDYATRLLKLTEFYEKVVSKTGNDAYLAMQRDMQQRLQFGFVRQDLPDLLKESIDGIDRVSEIVKNLKAFSHVDNAQWQPADLVDGLENTLKIAANQLKYKVEIHRDYAEDLPQVYCQPNQINQVFLNLLVNAAQAMEHKGHLYLRAWQQNKDVCIEVRDTGPGISSEHMKRLFEPFFTTKPVGSGTGLGLSLSYSIVKKHHGEIQIHSTPGEGASFVVILPITGPEKTADLPGSEQLIS